MFISLFISFTSASETSLRASPSFHVSADLRDCGGLSVPLCVAFSLSSSLGENFPITESDLLTEDLHSTVNWLFLVKGFLLGRANASLGLRPGVAVRPGS